MKRFIFTLLICFFVIMANAQKLQDFENIANPKGDFFVNDANFASVELADNPLKYGINTSDKVAAVVFYTVNSGIIKINFQQGIDPVITYPQNPFGLDELYYDVLRFKYYSAGKLNKNIEFEPNGQPTSPKTIVQPDGYYYEEWAYVTLPLVNKTYNNFQIRVNRNATGDGSALETAVGEEVYIDDFEMYNSTDGPITAIKLTKIEPDFSCTDLAEGNFCVKATLDKQSDVRFDLISIDGHSQTIFNQKSAGIVEAPFHVNQKGIYCVRMIIDNSRSKTIKILVK